MTTRAIETLNTVLIIAFAYVVLAVPTYIDSFPLRILPTVVQVEIIPVLPFWALITLAAYLLGRLGLGVLQFNDTHEAYTELMTNIDQAKKDLDGRKVGWD